MDNLGNMQEEIQFMQKNQAVTNIYEDIEMNARKLNQFLDTVHDNTERQIDGLKEMRAITNYDKIIVS